MGTKFTYGTTIVDLDDLSSCSVEKQTWLGDGYSHRAVIVLKNGENVVVTDPEDNLYGQRFAEVLVDFVSQQQQEDEVSPGHLGLASEKSKVLDKLVDRGEADE